MTAAAGVAVGAAVGPELAQAAGASSAAEPEAQASQALVVKPNATPTDPYTQAFLTQYNKMKAAASGYFSSTGVPYHSVETLMVEAPDHGHETTSEAFSYWMWLEATYGRITGDWAPFNNAWVVAESTIIPSHTDQPTNDSYNPSAPATYAPEWPDPSGYPSPLDTSVSVGSDPIAAELKTAYGVSDIYGMHWLMDVDNVYGYGNKVGTGAESGPTATGPCFINTYQRGSQESVWETIPQPTTDLFTYGGPNGYLDLFVKQSGAYAKQWKYTNAPDADARAIQAAYWAFRWATAQGNAAAISASVTRAAKMGDYLRYAMFDKYFKTIGNCVSPTSCAAGSGSSSQHYLLGWYYAWGGAEPGGGWAWRIGDGAAHHGYQNPVAAYALSSVSALAPKSTNGKSDWTKSLARQIEFLRWLQSAEGAIAGGCTNSWNGAYGTPPSGDSTFYGMAYDFEPVYHDPPSNNWFGMQVWGMERWAEYFYLTGDASIKPVLDKWVTWAASVTTVGPASGVFSIPSNLTWSGQPDTWVPASPGSNASLHATVASSGQDVGVAAGLAKAFTYYAKATNNATIQALAKGLLDALSVHTDTLGVGIAETRTDYSRFADPVFVPTGWSGTMPNGNKVQPGSTFSSIRTFYQNDPAWPKVQAFLNGGAAPAFTYHRFWAQADMAMAFAVYAELFEATTSTDTTPPSTPTAVTVTAKTSTSVSLSWTASTDNVGVTGYQVFRNGTQVGTPVTTTFTDTGLTASTTYAYTVKARDAAGNVSAASTAVSATTTAAGDTTPPSAPSAVHTTATTSTSVSLAWTASTDNVGVTGYQVFRNGTQVGTATATTFTDTGLTASTTYAYTVKAQDAAGNLSTASTAVNATTSAASGGGGSVTAAYSIQSDWGAGFVANITVTNNGSTAISAWEVDWTFGGNQVITNFWSSTLTQSGTHIAAKNASYNGSIPAHGSTTFGFQATYSGSNAIPTLTVTGS